MTSARVGTYGGGPRLGSDRWLRLPAIDRWLRPLRQLSLLLLGFLGSRDFLLQRRDQVVLATHLLTHEFSLPFQALDLLGVGQRLCYGRAESQGTGADEGATHQALRGTHSHLHLSGENCCELEPIRVLSNAHARIQSGVPDARSSRKRTTAQLPLG